MSGIGPPFVASFCIDLFYVCGRGDCIDHLGGEIPHVICIQWLSLDRFSSYPLARPNSFVNETNADDSRMNF
jgi:hypothetical protein